MSKVKISKYDLLDKFEAYQSEATYTGGNKSTHQMIAMSDVEKVIDELIEKLGNGKKFISSNS
jgi:CobQ-like glutamine amidotransferase family enzyme